MLAAAANPIYGTYDRSITLTKNIGLPDSLLSRFDLLFIVLDQMDPDIDNEISKHVLRMHRYRSVGDGGSTALDDNARRDREEETEAGSSVFVKYNRMLHGKKSDHKRETLAINFLKKFIHYEKNRIQPELTDEASEHMATTYAEFRNASSATKTGGTLPITARTLETILRLSTAHAKLKLRRQVLKSDVEAALHVLNFAIYHQELNEMEQREQREMAREQRAGMDTGDNDAPGGSRNMTANGRSTVNRTLEAFSSALGKYRHAQHVDQMSMADVEGVVNSGAAELTQHQRLSLLR